MTPDQIIFVQNALTAFGILILAVPAISLNTRKKDLERIRSLVSGRTKNGDKSALDSIAAELKVRKEESAAQWRRADEVCLYIGYFSLLGSALWRLF